jgi:hypothetical protein
MLTHAIRHPSHFHVPRFPEFVPKIFQFFSYLIIIGFLVSIMMLLSLLVLLPLLF